MTNSYSTGQGSAVENPSAWRRYGRWLLLVGTPLLLGGVLWFHPHGGDGLYDALTPVVDTWLLVHYLLLPLFGLLGVCLYLLLRGYTGPIATIGRIGVAVYLVFYIAFEAIAGIATGLLIREAQALPPEQQEGVAEAIQVVSAEPIAALALTGTVGAIVAVVAIAILLRRSGAPLVPVALLAGVPITVVGHGGGQVDVFGMILFGIGVVWLELSWRRTDEQRSAQAT